MKTWLLWEQTRLDRAGGFLGGRDTCFCPKETHVEGGNSYIRTGNRRFRRGNNYSHDGNNCVIDTNNEGRPGHDRVRSGNNRLAFGNERRLLVNNHFRHGSPSRTYVSARGRAATR